MTGGDESQPPDIMRIIKMQQKNRHRKITPHCSHAHGRYCMKGYVAGSRMTGRGRPFQHAGLGLGLGVGDVPDAANVPDAAVVPDIAAVVPDAI